MNKASSGKQRKQKPADHRTSISISEELAAAMDIRAKELMRTRNGYIKWLIAQDCAVSANTGIGASTR